MELKKIWTETVLPMLKDGYENVAKPAIEMYIEKKIEAKSDEYVDKIAAAIKKAIPGDYDDAFINAKLAEVKIQIKKEALEEAEKISDKV